MNCFCGQAFEIQKPFESNQPSGFAQQTEKDGEDHGIELNRIPEILRLFQQTAATQPQPANMLDWFSVSLLTQKRNVPLRLLTSGKFPDTLP